ncbi:cyclic pyranopterin monophosphate synthase MoaC [Prolixibacteraceae bacterium JC049]|nr:cyclic pyranopterin monophosphate synthase MoaC [Prolixibacteraceae bacterium JC049]
MEKLTHINAKGKASMVDVAEKEVQRRVAVASGFIELQQNTLQLIRDNEMKKGDVLTVAEIAGIQAAKRTHELIPLCHQLQLTKVKVNTEIVDNGVQVTCESRCNGQTGVEMEALTGVQVALLTIYDMCKAVDKQMVMSNIKLESKTKEDL